MSGFETSGVAAGGGGGRNQPPPPPTTRAVRFHRLGGPEVLQIETVALAPPGPGEVCIRVEALGLNRAEAAFRGGHYLEQPNLPSGLGYEAAGVIVALGPDVPGFAPGDPVCVLPAISMTRHPLQAEYAVVPASALVARPAGLDAPQAAALWMAALTAYGGLVDIGKLGPGDGVIVTAASSSVGIAALQLARALGAIPIALTRDPGKVEALRRHGAEHVIVGTPDATLASRVAAVTGGLGARLAFDPVAGPTALPLAAALRRGGTLVVYGNLGGEAEHTPFPFYAAVGKGLSMRGYLVFELLADARRLAAARGFIELALAAGTLFPVIDRVFPFNDIVGAYRHLESNAQVGKVVVSLDHGGAPSTPEEHS